ncbi:MAG: Lon protease [Chlamydiia bacterium]|nr:Lon protease [Chlamydiia bacterium]
MDDELKIERDELISLLDETGAMIEDGDKNDYPDHLPILPLVKRPFPPSLTVPLMVEKGIYYDLLKEMSKSEHKFIGLLLTKDEEQDVYDVKFDDLYDVGVVARILRIVNVSEKGAQVIVNIEKRFKVLKRISKKSDNYLVSAVSYHEEKIPPKKKDEISAYVSSVIKLVRELVEQNSLYKEELKIFLNNSEFSQPWKLCDFAASLTTVATREDLQEILSLFDMSKRMEKVLKLLKHELDISKMQGAINQKIETTITKTQREYFLKEQLKAIKKELGIAKDDKTLDVEKFQERAKDLKMSDEAKKIFTEEIEKLSVLEVQSAEYSVVRNYLDWLTILPWGVLDKESHSIAEATKILDSDHYGLKDIKERIIEYMSVGALKKTGTKGYIICLVGPPGVGKTSVGKSIARALNRQFYRFSLGGMRDEAEIKGHRRTYIGAMPGKILQALKSTKSSNPVIMLDEIDKLGQSYQGDPASALLEVLDPEQNTDFLDHYLDCRFDLSNILFIMTANSLDTIPSALLDRFEVLRLSGYIKEEKMKIASKYLIKKNRDQVGLKALDVSFKADALHKMIDGYCREAGVRQLEKSINKVLRKVAADKVKKMEKKTYKKVKVEVSEKNIEKFLGKPKFTSERFYKEDSHKGVVTGLAWTEYGGSILYIEAITNPGKERLRLTGNVGDVMNESSSIALSYVYSQKNTLLPKDFSSEDKEIHIHVPEGATPKDGPSAGIAMATAIISLLTDKPVPDSLAMTGEITLTGKVLPIGGVKEKVIAAKRENITKIIMPKKNKRDFDELPAHIKKGVDMYFVENYKEVYQLIFGGRRKRLGL